MEQLFLHRDIIRMISSHFLSSDKGEPDLIPDELLDGLLASKKVVDALGLLSLVFQSTYDLTIHSPPSHEAIQNMSLPETFNRLRRDIGLVPGPEEPGESMDTVHGHTRFRAIMGSYDSMYYTYLL
jgi:metallopeptidase MepB